MGATFDAKARRVQALGVGQLQARKPRLHRRSAGGVEHVSRLFRWPRYPCDEASFPLACLAGVGTVG